MVIVPYLLGKAMLVGLLVFVGILAVSGIVWLAVQLGKDGEKWNRRR